MISTIDRAIERMGEAAGRALETARRVFCGFNALPAAPIPAERLTQAKLAHKESQDRRNEHLWDAYISGKKYRKVERFTHEDKMVRRVGYADARDFIGDLLVNGPMRDELRVTNRVSAIAGWYKNTLAVRAHPDLARELEEALHRWFSEPAVMP